MDSWFIPSRTSEDSRQHAGTRAQASARASIRQGFKRSAPRAVCRANPEVRRERRIGTETILMSPTQSPLSDGRGAQSDGPRADASRVAVVVVRGFRVFVTKAIAAGSERSETPDCRHDRSANGVLRRRVDAPCAAVRCARGCPAAMTRRAWRAGGRSRRTLAAANPDRQGRDESRRHRTPGAMPTLPWGVGAVARDSPGGVSRLPARMSGQP
jgi:hypothetical protein